MQLLMTASSTFLFSMRTTLVERGCSTCCSSRRIDWNSIITREIFSPPAVEPEHPPRNISTKRIPWESAGQAVKSTVEKPVVERMDAVWKKAWRADSSALPYNGAILKAITPEATTTMDKKHSSSWLRRAVRNRPMAIKKNRLKLMPKNTIKKPTTH